MVEDGPSFDSLIVDYKDDKFIGLRYSIVLPMSCKNAVESRINSRGTTVSKLAVNHSGPTIYKQPFFLNQEEPEAPTIIY
jgi:hypothetical protein